MLGVGVQWFFHVIKAEVSQRLTHLVIGLAGSDQADPGVPAEVVTPHPAAHPPATVAPGERGVAVRPGEPLDHHPQPGQVTGWADDAVAVARVLGKAAGDLLGPLGLPGLPDRGVAQLEERLMATPRPTAPQLSVRDLPDIGLRQESIHSALR